MKKLLIGSFSLILFLNLSCSQNSIEPEEQFVQLYIKYNHKDELNTFENYLIKDLVLDGTIKIDFWLTKEEQLKIQDKIFEIDYFSLPDSLLNTAPVEISSNPVQHLKVRIDDSEKSVSWNYTLPEFQNEQHLKIYELSDYLINIIETKPEFKSLPPRNGGYD